MKIGRRGRTNVVSCRRQRTSLLAGPKPPNLLLLYHVPILSALLQPTLEDPQAHLEDRALETLCNVADIRRNSGAIWGRAKVGRVHAARVVLSERRVDSVCSVLATLSLIIGCKVSCAAADHRLYLILGYRTPSVRVALPVSSPLQPLGPRKNRGTRWFKRHTAVRPFCPG